MVLFVLTYYSYSICYFNFIA